MSINWNIELTTPRVTITHTNATLGDTTHYKDEPCIWCSYMGDDQWTTVY
jgi:hypothetical protein